MKKAFSILTFLLIAIHAASASAGVIVGGTRVIYSGDNREATLSVRNPDKTAYLIQAWADNGYSDGDTGKIIKAPFLVTPPLFRLDAGSENILRIIRSDDSLNNTQESLSWMNVKSIPSMSDGDKNILQIAVKTRIKLIFRPKGLDAPGDKDYARLTFKKESGKLIVQNPTPYYISFNSLSAGGEKLNDTMLMVPPNNTVSFTYPANAKGNAVTWTIINDYGGTTKEYTSHF